VDEYLVCKEVAVAFHLEVIDRVALAAYAANHGNGVTFDLWWIMWQDLQSVIRFCARLSAGVSLMWCTSRELFWAGIPRRMYLVGGGQVLQAAQTPPSRSMISGRILRNQSA
jgi:hypothetical protein